MARKKAPASKSPDESSPELDNSPQKSSTEIPPIKTSSPQTPRESIKVNKYNLKDLKNACDDALRKHLSRPDSFQQQHTHTDIRLALGYASIIIGGATAFYSWYVGFEPSKPFARIGIALYFILTFLQTLYAWFVEKDTIFVGKRKTLDKRILTERLSVSSKTVASTPSTAPQYSLDISYLHSANSGKTVLRRGRETDQKEFNRLFDSDGCMSQETFEHWVDGLVSKATSS